MECQDVEIPYVLQAVSTKQAGVDNVDDDDFGDFQAFASSTERQKVAVEAPVPGPVLPTADHLLKELLSGETSQALLPLSSALSVEDNPLLPPLSQSRPLLHDALNNRLHSYAGFSQRRSVSSSSLRTSFFAEMHVATHGQLGTTPNHHWMGPKPEEHYHVLPNENINHRFATTAPTANQCIVQRALLLAMRIAEGDIDRATPLEFDLEASTDRLAQLELTELQAWKQTLETQIDSLSAELIASLSQRDRHLHEQSVRSKLVESLVQAAMAVPVQSRPASLSSSSNSQDEASRTSRHLVIPYQADKSSKDLTTCEGIFRLLDAWQQHDDDRVAALQRKHLSNLA
eukprot:m.21130 g.21130  ORF g.21130 m.21130 type:complete len:344 (+) comp11101_c0_seq1:50-1081(+)